MAHSTALTCVSRIAGASLTGAQYTMVSASGNLNVVAPSAGAAVLGILQNDPASGEEAAVAVGGESKIKLGANLAAGAQFATNASGAAVALTTGANIVGRITVGGNSGEIGSCIIDAAGASA